MQSTNTILTHNNNNNNSSITSTNITTIHDGAHHRTHGGSTTQACAACKYHRRKCASDCILAPYFPHDSQRQFLNAHRLFGVKNIIRIVNDLEPPAKDHAMRTIIFQSDARAADPVGGCYRIIRDLEQQINLAQAELEIVLHHLALCRAAAAARHQAAGGDVGVNYDEKWRGAAAAAAPYAEEELGVIDDVNSWNCMNGNGNVNGESTSSSFIHENGNHMRSLSMEECNHHDMKKILDQFSGDDDESHEEYKFDSHGNIVPSNNNSILTEENGTFKEDEGTFSYIDQDHNDLKAAATYFTLTNCDI
ncbi:hypothetical protein CDL12_25640 [Handroanthus impetiginosus]|uniref:LOB domain-containing protein n=1 Tax=Handroanthus impetiginosus TaxID=429701 RepID=A0A2G9G971_9LAMI|nr:hypothetical protein CDL12_25640 [Handroanthus impetiginosus]